MCIGIVSKPGCDVMNSEVKPIFLIKTFFLHNQKLVTKEIFKRRSIEKITQFLRVRFKSQYDAFVQTGSEATC